MNSVSIEFANRANDYNPDIAEDKDDAMIALYGLRKASPVQAHSITTSTVAKFAANLLRKRSVEIRATYTFSLGWQFNLLEPMDLVTLTIPELGYNKKPVRITAMREDDSGKLEVDAKIFPGERRRQRFIRTRRAQGLYHASQFRSRRGLHANHL